jgi:hypothetical protein
MLFCTVNPTRKRNVTKPWTEKIAFSCRQTKNITKNAPSRDQKVFKVLYKDFAFNN